MLLGLQVESRLRCALHKNIDIDIKSILVDMPAEASRAGGRRLAGDVDSRQQS